MPQAVESIGLPDPFGVLADGRANDRPDERPEGSGNRSAQCGAADEPNSR
jgi:hypothetical protein